MLFWKNDWFVSIASGVIVFIITTVAIKVIRIITDKSKHLANVKEANAEILRALKPYVAEKGLPEKEVIDAIIVSTARKYYVQSSELFSVRIICEELIHEIIENVFVSSDKKHDYSMQLIDYLHNLNQDKDESLLISDIESDLKRRATIEKSKIEALSSTTVALIAGITTILASIVSSYDFLDGFLMSWDSFVGVAIAVISLVFFPLIIAFFVRFTHKKDDNEK